MKLTQEIINKQAITKQLSVCEFVRKKTTKTKKKPLVFIIQHVQRRIMEAPMQKREICWVFYIYFVGIQVKLS